MVPTNATSSTKAMCSTCGKTIPVATIRPAPSISMLRRSCRGATKPTASVSSDEPSSAAVATKPISTGVKPIAER